jgi:dipeptidase E
MQISSNLLPNEPAMRQLIVLGGGGFLMEKNRALDRYFLDATGKANPRVCFVGTASGDAESARYKFYEAMATLGCRATHLSLVQPPTADLASFVLEQDAIYVGGGNTRSLLALWREWGLDAALRTAYEHGVVMGGISAGMICWFEYGITDSVPGALSPLPGLGWLRGTACPHYDGEAERRPAFHRLLAEGKVPPGYAADDGAALHFVDEALRGVVRSRAAASAYRLDHTEAGVRESALDARLLANA